MTNGEWYSLMLGVLILVVVDDGLVQSKKLCHRLQSGLNPCCSGRWSRTKVGLYRQNINDKKS